MSMSNRSAKADMIHLTRLPAEKPATKAGQLRWLWPEISAALKSGHNLRAICDQLRADGIEVPYSRLRYYVALLKREQASERSRDDHGSGPPPRPDPPAIALSDPPPPASLPAHDPLSNLREQHQRKREAGFDYDPFSTTKKLF